MSNSPIVTLHVLGSRGTPSAVRAPSLLLPLLFASVFAVGCTSTVTGEGTSSSSGGAGTSSGTNDGTTTGGGTSQQPNGQTAPDTSEYDAMFGPPETSALTENAVGGLWAGQAYSNDARFKITASSITVAMKCTGRTIGTKFAAQVSANSIRIVESQQIGNEYEQCSIKVRPVTIPRCETDYQADCFIVKGTTLTFTGARLFSAGSYGHEAELTKLSD